MRELHLVIRDVAHAPPSYYRAVEGANEISKDGLDLARELYVYFKVSMFRR
jgi:hypothetical protein